MTATVFHRSSIELPYRFVLKMNHFLKSAKRSIRMRIQEKSILPNDVFLVSYPRSGNTWLRYLLANILFPDSQWNIGNIGQVVPDIHEEWPGNLLQIGPRIIKSHFPFRSAYKKVIYLYRDGRDVAVSYYDFQKKVNNYSHSFGDFLREFVSGNLPYGSWQNHIVSWLVENKPPSLLTVRYKDLHNQPVDTIQKIGNFLGINWHLNKINYALEQSNFAKLQNDYKKYKLDSHWNKGFQGGVGGMIGSWRSVFSVEQLDFYWRYAGEISERLGYHR